MIAVHGATEFRVTTDNDVTMKVGVRVDATAITRSPAPTPSHRPAVRTRQDCRYGIGA